MSMKALFISFFRQRKANASRQARLQPGAQLRRITLSAAARWSFAARVAASLALTIAAATAATAAADDAAQQAQGRKLFTQLSVPACGLCHTLKAAETEGAVGPVLDELKPTAARVAKALRDGIGQMPSYKGKLNDEQINAIAAFVATASGAGN